MKPDRWEEIKSMVHDKFKVLEEKTEPIEMTVGLDEKQNVGNKEILIFTSPVGKTKLEFITKPVVLDKKEHYSKRMGTSAQTEYILSDTEFVQRLEAFVEKDGAWEKIDESTFN